MGFGLSATSDRERSSGLRTDGSANGGTDSLGSGVRRVLNTRLKAGKKVVQVRIIRVNERKIGGYVLLANAKSHERVLLDFEAALTPKGTVSSLELNGKRVV